MALIVSMLYPILTSNLVEESASGGITNGGSGINATSGGSWKSRTRPTRYNAINTGRMLFRHADEWNFDGENDHPVVLETALHEIGAKIAHTFDLRGTNGGFDNFHDSRTVAIAFVKRRSMAMRLFQPEQFAFTADPFQDVC